MPQVTPQLKQELMSRFEQYIDSQEELSEDNVLVMEMLPALLKLQNDKSLIYGRSYCRHGDLSIFLNTERKWDRISNIMDSAMQAGMQTLFSDKSSTPTETFVDTVVDLASYSLLWASFIRDSHPEEWRKFLEANNLS